MSERRRLRLAVRGAVQGVGFRPFVYRLARGLALDGWVLNAPQGVFIEVEGDEPPLRDFLVRFERERPPLSSVQSLETSWLDPVPYRGFEIRASTAEGDRVALVMPDIATCDDCLREILDPRDRRYRYPFTNCTNCGPRFSIIDSLPYDRPNTSMRRFPMCARCRREYEDPLDRRFHAQPTACPDCGPQLSLWDGHGSVVAERDEALRAAATAIQHGSVLAVKGLGGFHLVVDATNDQAVRRLRDRKHREEKPFAVMFPSLTTVREACKVCDDEVRLLTSPERPIVLLDRLDGYDRVVSPLVAPGNPTLGVMLPYTPLHHLLVADLMRPIVATSANLSDEPICIDEHEALERLDGIADWYLVHDRPIRRHVDDSVARVVGGRPLVLRRARGFAPLPVPWKRRLPQALAVGGHLKNAVAIGCGTNVFVSQHIGDLDTVRSDQAFRRTIDDLERLYDVSPVSVVADRHPDYRSAKYAATLGRPLTLVQHHYAHVLSCMAENELDGPALGVAWDGTGYGTDGTIWGGEFLAVDEAGFARVACLRPFRLPGGDRAVREPCRTAAALMHAMTGRVDDIAGLPPGREFTALQLDVLQRMLDRAVNAPVTTSAGRLFDAVASLAGLRSRTSFEGQAAMELEFAIDDEVTGAFPLPVVEHAGRLALGSWEPPRFVADWAPLVRALVDAMRGGEPVGAIAACFHNALCDLVVQVATRVGRTNVVLSGGCFQNRHLTEGTIARLRAAGFRPYWHQRVPPNDGGLALGQLEALAREADAAHSTDLERARDSQPVLVGGA